MNFEQADIYIVNEQDWHGRAKQTTQMKARGLNKPSGSLQYHWTLTDHATVKRQLAVCLTETIYDMNKTRFNCDTMNFEIYNVLNSLPQYF